MMSAARDSRATYVDARTCDVLRNRCVTGRRWLWGVIISVGLFAAAISLSVFNYALANSEIDASQTSDIKNTTERLERIENKLDRLLTRIPGSQ